MMSDDEFGRAIARLEVRMDQVEKVLEKQSQLLLKIMLICAASSGGGVWIARFFS
jgi:hypothetical protein